MNQQEQIQIIGFEIMLFFRSFNLELSLQNYGLIDLSLLGIKKKLDEQIRICITKNLDCLIWNYVNFLDHLIWKCYYPTLDLLIRTYPKTCFSKNHLWISQSGYREKDVSPEEVHVFHK